MVIVDDHLALLAIAARLPDLDCPGPVATTYAFHYRLGRAVADSSRRGALSRRLTEPGAALDRVLRPPGDRLIVLDPRISLHRAIELQVVHGTNLLLAELLGAARHHNAHVRAARPNVGRKWQRIMESESIPFAAVDV